MWKKNVCMEIRARRNASLFIYRINEQTNIVIHKMNMSLIFEQSQTISSKWFKVQETYMKNTKGSIFAPPQ